MKLLPFSIKDISTYRSELMGWAILWIMMLHFTFNQIKPLGFIAQYGFAGVEIFMFVSGFGLYYSLDKDRHIIRFYKKRLLRIFPTYYILGIIASIILFSDNLPSYLFRYTTLGFWIGSIYWEWYIPSIVMLYLVSPFLKKLIDRYPYIVEGVVLFTLGLAYYLIDKDQILDRSHFFFLYRIPAFIFGMICANWVKNGISSKYFFIILALGLPFFFYLFPLHHQIYRYKYFSLLFLLPCFTMLFILLSKYRMIKNTVISKIGMASLEIYLIQGIFFSIIKHGTISVPPIWHDTLTIALIIFCSLLGIITHWMIDKSGIQRIL
jgi:peptidoglycan/LPS O-acetylase OafA/YrhL